MRAAKLTTALEAVQFAGLEDVISGEGPFTMFLPTNEGFKKLPNDVTTDKGKEEGVDQALSLLAIIISRFQFPEKLREVLLYHVVPGLAPSSAVSNDLGLKSAGGPTIRMNIYLRYFLSMSAIPSKNMKTWLREFPRS